MRSTRRTMAAPATSAPTARCRVQPPVAVRPHPQDVLGEDRQQRGRRREERREEVEQHRRPDERLREHEPQPSSAAFRLSVSGRVLHRTSLPFARTSRIMSSATITHKERRGVEPVRRATPPVAIDEAGGRRAGHGGIWNMIVFRLMALGRSARGTRFGISAWRAGPSNAPAAELSAASDVDRPGVWSPPIVSSASTAASDAPSRSA